MELKRDLSTKDNRQFWEHAEECSNKVKDWPDWKKEIIDSIFLKYSYTEEEYD